MSPVRAALEPKKQQGREKMWEWLVGIAGLVWEWLVKYQPASISAIAGSVTALCFGISLCIAWRQINKARQTQAETTARNIYNDYLVQSFNNPVFSYPLTYLDKFDFNNKKVNGTIEDFERYEWFVSILITSMREILDFLSDRKSVV